MHVLFFSHALLLGFFSFCLRLFKRPSYPFPKRGWGSIGICLRSLNNTCVFLTGSFPDAVLKALNKSHKGLSKQKERPTCSLPCNFLAKATLVEQCNINLSNRERMRTAQSQQTPCILPLCQSVVFGFHQGGFKQI